MHNTRKKIKSDLNEIVKRRNKSEEQKGAIKSIKKFWSQENVIKLFNDCSKILSEAKYKAKYGEGLKILTPKQMLQRLSKALTQLKAGNTSENLLNELRQIIFFVLRKRNY